MSGFLNYVDDFDLKNQKQKVLERKEETTKIEPKKSSVLSLQVEIRTIEGAQKVIDKLQEWISKKGGNIVEKKNIQIESVKPIYKIPPKKVVVDKVQEARNRAMDILDGLPDEPVINEALLQAHSINNQEQVRQPQVPQQNLETVAGHASALLEGEITMATVTTNAFRQAAATSNVSLSADTFYVALTNYTFSLVPTAVKQQTVLWLDISATAECSGTGYIATQLTASNVSAESYPSGVVYWKGSNVSWSNVTVDAYGCAIFRSSDSLIVGFIDFGNLKQTVNGTFNINWNANGIMNIT